ncbi:MAG: MipA/OmpV family protein [Hyphomicrobiales bacterium]|nr:MipA/OmpV family protein [Hyphomicrobiales bacterium]
MTKRRSRILAVLAAAGLALAGGEAMAEDPLLGGDPQFLANLGVGVIAKPKYPGADKYIAVPFPIAEFSRFFLPVLGQQETRNANGFFIAPSFGYYGERKPSDDNSLKGTKKIDASLELGLAAGARQGMFRGFASVRQGFGGHDGQVGDLGLDIATPLTSRLLLVAGPRASWGTSDYMQTYYGVTAKEAAAGNLAQYKTSGGFESVGVAARLSYAVNDRTRLHLRGSWDRLIGDAGDSPIVKAGSKDQWTAGIGISRRIGFDLFR